MLSCIHLRFVETFSPKASYKLNKWLYLTCENMVWYSRSPSLIAPLGEEKIYDNVHHKYNSKLPFISFDVFFPRDS